MTTQLDFLIPFFAQSSAGLVAWDASLNIVYCNSAFSRCLGFAPEDLKGLNFKSLAAENIQAEAMAFGDPLTAWGGRQILCRSRGGSLVGLKLHPIGAASKDENISINIVYDEAELTLVRREIDRLRQRYSAIYDHAAFPMVLVKIPEGIICEVNDSWEIFFESSREEVIGRTIEDVGVEVDSHVKHGLYREVMEKGFVRNYEISFRTPRGNLRYGLFNSDRVELDHRIFHLGGMIDITDRKLAEFARNETLAKLEAAIASTADIIYIVDNSGATLHFNDLFIEKFRLPLAIGDNFLRVASQLVEKQTLDGVPLSPSNWPVSRALRGEKRSSLELKVKCRQTQENWIGSYSFAPIIDPAGVRLGAVITVRDVTQQKRDAAELEAAKMAAEQANQAKGLFLATMSHEIRNPLNAIIGFAELLASPTLSASAREEYATRVSRNGQLLLRLIDDILDLSKIEAGHVEIEKINVSWNELWSDLSGILEPQARQKNLPLLTDWPDQMPRFVSDPHRIKQILLQVIGNAIKFTDQGEVRVRVRANLTERSLRVEIQDTRIGLSPEQAQLLFEPFRQFHSSSSRLYGGAGLGLYLARRLAQALDGDLFLAQSQLGSGCLFILTFAADFDPAHNSLHSLRSELEQLGLKGTRVLLAEDSPDNQLLMRKHLGDLGVIVEVAVDGLEAVAKAKVESFDIILMDIRMPNLDGFGATAILRQEKIAVPIIALTAHSMQEEIERCLQLGFDDHVPKPVNIERLARAMSQALKTIS